MNDATFFCLDEQRRHQVRKEGYNGLDYLEVSEDQLRLSVYLLEKVPATLVELIEEDKKNNTAKAVKHFRISGGRRVRDIQIIDVTVCQQRDPELDDCLVLTVDRPGDFSTYTLCMVALDEDGRPTDQPYPNFDPRYACLDFSFKENCPSDLDCRDVPICPPELPDEPEINYLAKDYASFRQLILDRLATIMPDWQERHVPDLGITLVELLAYAGDHLSYYQDAVATEAYLDTARQRISVRRHARLVDYRMHEGCNARAFLCLEVDGNPKLDPDDVSFITRLADALPNAGPVLAAGELQAISADRYESFAPLLPPSSTKDETGKAQLQAIWDPQREKWQIEAVKEKTRPIKLTEAHNRIRFYTWGDAECCLPKGAISATLVAGPPLQPPVVEVQTDDPKGQQTAVQHPPDDEPRARYEHVLKLKKGDFLIFEEVIGPKTGNPADADPRHRHVVRLTNVTETVDELYRQPLLEIEWAEEDALPFPLCLSAIGDDCQPLRDISIACGNVILVDHGRPIYGEDLGSVPAATTEAECECGRKSDMRILPGPYRPQLKRGPLTFSQPVPHGSIPAATLRQQDPRQALPRIRLHSFPNNQSTNNQSPAFTWQTRYDLLASQATDRHVAVEVDNDGRAHLRFGNDELGQSPEAGEHFLASYRIGGGLAGNVGAETITHLVYRRHKLDGIRRVRNPLPATGGIAPEALDDVKRFAPYAFRDRIERAITADDYAHIVIRDFSHKVQRAAATLRWMGSWYEVLVAVDAMGKTEADPTLLDEITAHLYRYRRMGHDLAVRPARQVPLDIEMVVCVPPHYLRGHVKAALLNRFSNRRLPDGSLGFFHPDNLTFGEGVYLSKLVAAAQAVPGVGSVQVTKLQRRFEEANGEIEAGLLQLGPLEVARLDNDPSFPENGRFTLIMRGGR